ncbi:SDR family oxidoreductase [Cryobacterium frigoriphilum]|uniref:SDR family oxidoreductase n=1 Tax=Cryobacterium frigoriphilum TaxID=1259150 RepID=A0A4R9A7B1_9MICO|nr:SDR family oxidoreductase [Cryobacterium frigoriphilum]TFD53550.1 SDR family oxidoreductase [Cryobacterium frigoriphilum]
MDLQLHGKTALIPGSSSGLGLAIARALSAEGANVVLCGRRTDLVEAEAARLPNALGIALDLAADAAPADLVAAATARFGPIDILVLNGGGPPHENAENVTDDQVLAAVHTLLLQQIRLTRLVLPGMRERGWGRILSVGSSGVQQPIPGLALSNMARAGLAGYLKTLAAEVAADGVTVNMVIPGRIDTDRVASLDRSVAAHAGLSAEAARIRSEATIPLGRYGRPEEYAAVVTFLAGEGASYVTGTQLRVDGGLVRAH